MNCLNIMEDCSAVYRLSLGWAQSHFWTITLQVFTEYDIIYLTE